MANQQWYYAVDGRQAGPVSESALRGMISSGQVAATSLAWREGMSNWQEVSRIAEFQTDSAVGADPLPVYFEQLTAETSPAPAYAASSATAVAPAPLAYSTYVGAAQPRIEYAGFWLRFCAYVVDFVALFILGFVIGFGLQVVARLQLPFYLAVVIGWLYYALMESSEYQGTLGKLAVGIKVTELNGSRIGFGRATGRHFAKTISAIILLIGFLMAGFTERKQALHDMIASTLVIRR